MAAEVPSTPRRLIALRTLCLLWAGLAAGISFVATPAKFSAPSLSLSTALEVGQATFAWSHAVQFGFALAVAICVISSRAVWRILPVLAIAVLGTQHLVILPALDARTAEVIAGTTPAGSSLHLVYIGFEVAKLAFLVASGLLVARRA